MRDVMSVVAGEKVTIYAGPSVFATGYYLGLDREEGYILVDAPRVGPEPVKVSVYSTWMDVVDSHGSCLGVMDPEPDLRGATPDLE